jgi:hypothetical protein
VNVPLIRIGLPYSSGGRLTQETQRLGAPTLLSVGSMWRDGAFTPIGLAAWTTPASLDSAGFTAMLKGGYRWEVADYVEFVVTNSGDGSMPFPWNWWSAMDYCCEPEIAGDRAEVQRRITLTVDAYAETMEHLNWWREEGVNDVPDPMPILQGRTAADYLGCALHLAPHCSGGELPALVGVGSVCRRDLHGPEGLIAILSALNRELPPHVKLHLFGVKGALLAHLRPWAHRIASVDSMAWDFRARSKKRHDGVPYTVENRAVEMRRWYELQHTAMQAVTNPTQLSLFGSAA